MPKTTIKVSDPKFPFEKLCATLGSSYESISLSRSEADRIRGEIDHIAKNGATDGAALPIQSPDTSIVFFGSLARREWTQGSDVDWTLLVDGPADPQHREVAREFARRLEDADFRKPGPAGVFGCPVFSHDLIHLIGGEGDTNANLTRRILLLLESSSLATIDAHIRVVRGVLSRYLDSEKSFLGESGRRYKVPRFLLNDIVRYWRTIAVDYVNKQWDRGDQGWALRNIKLRFSRKLLFVSGLLACFTSYLEHSVQKKDELFKNEDEARQAVKSHLAQRLELTPIDSLAHHLLSHAKKETSNTILSAYDTFLERLNEPDSRKILSELPIDRSYSDSLFSDLREASHQFQDGLNAMFFDDDERVHALMRMYGVF